MKNILWCGGSHLSNAKSKINHWIDDHIFQHNADFYVTAGPKTLEWSANGGRYTIEGSIVSGSPYENDRKIDLLKYDLIIFIGQYIQPSRILSKNTTWDDIFSKDLLNEYFKYGIIHPMRWNGHPAYNEPFILFKELSNCNIIVLADPFPSSRDPQYFGTSIPMVKLYYESFVEFCNSIGLIPCFQPEPTIDNSIYTPAKFDRSFEDHLHKSLEFWELVFNVSLAHKFIEIFK
jgi:hypothetical protein